MSSFDRPGPTAWGKVTHSLGISVVTIDEFASSTEYRSHSCVKSDIQGYAYEVLRGQ